MKKNYDVFLILGSNISDKQNNIFGGVKRIDKLENIKIKVYSSLYITKPWGYQGQKDFYNVALKIQTGYKPMELLVVIKEIENKMGRKKNIKWGPRIIDIDIALYDNLIIKNSDLIIPHQYLLERDFFLYPIIEIDEDLLFPGTNKKLEYFLNRIENKSIIRKTDIKINLRC